MNERAEVIDAPRLAWSTGAPQPFLVSSEGRTVFAFYAPDDGSAEREVRVAEFVGCTSVCFGFPNDETLHGHRLWGRGLRFYTAHEVIGSMWLAELRETERHHPQSAAIPFADKRHYLLTFHDTTLEAIADSVAVQEEFATIEAAVAWMTTAASA